MLGASCRKAGNIKPHAPRVWIIDDGLRVARRAGPLTGINQGQNPIWNGAGLVELIALPGETIAFQVVVSAGLHSLREVRVELPKLQGPGGIIKQNPDATWSSIERFVVWDIPVRRRSGGVDPEASLGWLSGFMPDDPSAGGAIPDALVPVQLAGSGYPLRVPPGEHRVVWFDVTIPEAAPAGIYRGELHVHGAIGNESSQALATFQVSVHVGRARMPYAPVKTMVYFDPKEIVGRTAELMAVNHHQQLMHRHHLTTIFPIVEPEQVTEHRLALTGELFTSRHGYHGPGDGIPLDVVVLGSYGDLGEPSQKTAEQVESILAALRELGITDDPGCRELFLYAVDENCQSPLASQWRTTLHASVPRRLRIGQTCSEALAGQSVDIVMASAGQLRLREAKAACEAGKTVWIYNGLLPHTGSFLADGWTLDLRANGWIQAMHGLERWFYWESTFWNDSNRGGHGPYDPFLTCETFHNQHGDWCNGDGLLVYPGKQHNTGWTSFHLAGVLPSIRLKQWRRGILDAGYVQLARDAGKAKAADQIARRLIARSLDNPARQNPPWSQSAQAFYQARKRLWHLINQS